MVKTVNKKKQSTSKNTIEQKVKLPRGFKQCFNCKNLLNIHKYVCDNCGHRHDMKKKKIDILKNLNNMTPKLLKSLIELNDFNDISQFIAKQVIYPSTLINKKDLKIPLQYGKKKSSLSRKNNQNRQQKTKLSFTQNKNYSYIKIGQKLTSICPIFQGILIAQTIQKSAQHTQSQKITISAYKLQQFHKIGQLYKGKSSLLYIKNGRIQYKININQHIISMKSIFNRVGLLTGKNTIIIIDLEIQINYNEEFIYQMQDYIEIQVPVSDQITCFQWIKDNQSLQVCKIIVGTLFGHLYLYSIKKDKLQLERFFANAHFQAITAISQSPLNNTQECLFASGSYDGAMSVWSIYDHSPLFTMEASNRKITSIKWDPGAKFIFIIRDQNQDSGVLICFFSVAKAQQSVLLSDQVDSRLIRNSINCKILHDTKSSNFYLLDPYLLQIRILQIQQLRKNSLKRKKIKRQQQDQKTIQFDFPYGVRNDGNKQMIQQRSEQQLQMKMNEKILPLPLIADGCQIRSNNMDTIWIVSYDGYLFQIVIK